MRIIGEDGSEDNVKINAEEKDEKTNAIRRINDITVGRYDVRIAVGPSYTTRRIESADSMIQFVQAVPAAGQSIMDLVAKTMDWPGADEIAERSEKLIPPNLLGDDEQGDEGMTPAQVEALVQQAVMQAAQQFEQSVQDREVQVKEFEAMTDRLEALDKAMQAQGPDEERIRELVAETIAEFVTQANGGNMTSNQLQSPKQP